MKQFITCVIEIVISKNINLSNVNTRVVIGPYNISYAPHSL